MKKLLIILLSVILALSSSVCALADEITTANNSIGDFIWDVTEKQTEPETEENTTLLIDEGEVDIIPGPDEEITTEEETITEKPSEAEDEVPPPAETTTSSFLQETEKFTPYTTIYLDGLKLNYTMTIKNTETGKKYKLAFNKENNWATTFEGPEGIYKIVSLSNGSVSVRAAGVYDSDNNKVTTIEIKRINDWQDIRFHSKEKATYNVWQVIKDHWFILSLIVILSFVYYYIKKHRILPSQPR